MSGFLALHLIEDGGRRRIGLAQAVGEVAVDSPILFLQRDCEREDLRLRKLAKVFGHHTCSISSPQTGKRCRPSEQNAPPAPLNEGPASRDSWNFSPGSMKRFGPQH